MIEVFTKKRLLLAFVLIIVLSFSAFIVQSHWTYMTEVSKLENEIKTKAAKTAKCSSYETMTSCEKCPREELRSLKEYCMETGYKEMIRCQDGTQQFIWCDISPAVEERTFWKFQATMLALAMLSGTVVYLRQQKLDKILMEKIHKQIGL